MLEGLPCLHDANNHSVHDVLALRVRLLGAAAHQRACLRLFKLGWNVVDPDVSVVVVLCKLGLLLRREVGRLHVLLVDDLRLRVAHVLEGVLEVSLGDPREGL